MTPGQAVMGYAFRNAVKFLFYMYVKTCLEEIPTLYLGGELYSEKLLRESLGRNSLTGVIGYSGESICVFNQIYQVFTV